MSIYPYQFTDRYSTGQTICEGSVCGGRLRAVDSPTEVSVELFIREDGMGQPRVLIVEDDATMAETIASIVQLLGFHAIVTHNSRQALAAATREHPDVILLDINLPGINGIDVCRFLKREPALETTPVIVVSSEKDPETFVKAREAGAIDYLIKPVGVNDLELAIGKALNP